MKAGVFLVVFGLSLTRAVGTLSSEVSARVWLRGHAAPQQDELAELKAANPEAYALVNALLTKRSLGLLDPKHPTASFQTPAAKADDAPSGVAAYAALTTPKDEEIEARKQSDDSDVSAPPQHHIVDMFNWKPQASAADDDTLVQNVLGAASQLTRPGGNAPVSDLGGSSLATDADLLDGEAGAKTPPAAAAATAQAPVEPVASPPPAAGENSYLKGLNLNGMTTNGVSEAALKTAQSKGADLSADAQLFDGSDTGDATPGKVPTAPAPQAEAKPDPLSSWLGVKKVVKKVQQTAAAPAKPSNPYAVDWNN